MAELSEIKKKLREIVGANPNLPITAIVNAVQDDHCSVQLASGLVLSDVKLKATITEGGDYFMLVPKVGSTILMMSLTGQLDNLTIIKVDEVEKISYKQNGLDFLIDSTDQKVMIKNENTGLYELFDLLTTLLKEFKVFTPVGPSGTALPPTVLKIEELTTKFKQILKAN
ncbi:MAG: hypothetical protein ACOH2D_11590 [Gelidibacter sp.]